MTAPAATPPPGGFDASATSVAVRRASAGDREAFGFLVARLSPLLAAQARYRLRGPLERLYDPDDLVQDAWVRTLPRLGDLREREGRLAPVLLRFLSTTLLRHVNQLLRKHVLGKPGTAEAGPSGTSPLSRLSDDATGAATRAARDEEASLLRAAVEGLDDLDREILVLRGVEQLSNRDAAQALGLADSTAAMRYRRALDRLRARVPASLFDELPD